MIENENKRILLVEDEAVIALYEKTLLEKNGLKVDIATNGEKAVRFMESTRNIDLILMDIDLGSGIDGTEAAERILEKREIPIVFLTSHNEREIVKKVKGITRYGYVLKNSGEFVLLESIQTAFELFEAHKKLQRSENRYRAMVETAPMPFQSLDENGCIIDVNRAWLSTLRYTREEVIGTWFGDLLNEEQVALFRQRFPIFKREGHIEKVDFKLRRSDGTYINTLYNGCIAYNEEGKFSHTVCIFQEIHKK